MLLLLVLYILKKLFFVKEELIFGVYRKNTRWFWLKFIFLIAAQKMQHLYRKLQQKVVSVELYEKSQTLPEDALASDSVLFTGVNSKGYRLLFSIEKRKRGIFYGAIYLVTPDKGVYELPSIPDTLNFSTPAGEDSTIRGKQEFKAECVVPLKKWNLKYDGQFVDENKEIHNAQFWAEFTSEFGVFNYDTDLNHTAMARALALEKWSADSVRRWREKDSHFYEQMGKLNARIAIGADIHEFTMQGFRDHILSRNRDWSSIHRYALFILFLRNNTSLHVGVACQLGVVSNLLVGYICTEDGTYHSVESCNFELYQNGEHGDPPKDHCFQFEANSTVYTVQLKYERQFEHHVGNNWESRIIDRFVECNVNDVPGNGVVEYHYLNKSGRPEEYRQDDPEWYRTSTKQKMN